MGMDRNTLIGFILIGGLLITMFYFNSKNRLQYEAAQKKISDSIALVTQSKKDASSTKKDSTKLNQNFSPSQTGGFPKADNNEKLTTLENEVFKITFSNIGAQPRAIELKKFKKYDGSLVVLNQAEFNKINYRFNSSVNHTNAVNEIAFNSLPVIVNQDNSQTISFEIQDSTGKKITHEFTIRPNEYMIDFNIKINGADQLFSQHTINFEWNVESPRIEKDFNYELTQSHLGYLEDEKFNFEYISKEDSKELKKVSWIGIKQQFFLSSLIAKEKFTNSVSQWNLPHDTVNNFLSRVNTNASYNLQSGPVASASLQLYFGPSDYNILKKYNNQLENIVPYGSGIFAFVKYINRHFLLPVFDFLRSNIANMGIVILLLTLLIRLITSPILYKSYLSGAKMKVLKPEVDALKEKYKDDQQTFGMEQMKLWRSAGVSPLGGCIPALLQIPIFMSLYYFFQSNIDLRGKNFLWANDLAQYDSIAQLPFAIPFYGDHVSLFTITAVITSLLISLYGMSNMQDNSNPMMKYMPYIFPVLLLGVFNKLPSALTWYYTISNTITLILQIIIQKYIINHDKILTEITENRKKPAKKSKMQERIEAMQESQKKLLEMKNKSGK